jgi:hypothetical protein
MAYGMPRKIVSSHTLLLACIGVAAIAFGGCSKGKADRAVVHGSARFAGEPVQAGTIRFVPVDGTATPPAAAQITNGVFRVEARGGVPIGTYKLEIEAFRPLPPGKKDLELEATKKNHPKLEFQEPREQYIPPRYNAQSELKITIAPGSGDVEHNIDLMP